MPQAKHTTWMLLSLAFLIAGCGGGGGGAGRSRRRTGEPPPPGRPPAPPPAPPAPPGPTSWTGRAAQQRDLYRARSRHGQRHHRHAAGISEPQVRDPVTHVTQKPAPHCCKRRAMRAAGSWWSGSASCACSTITRAWRLPRFSSTSTRASSPRAPNAVCSGWRFIPIFPRRRACIWRTPAATHGRWPGYASIGIHLARRRAHAGSRFRARHHHDQQAPASNHHGGHIAFGPDGFLYFATGDGNGARNDAAQRLNTLLGKILRIDIRGTTGTALYRIPADNPFAASTALCNVNGSGPQNCPEIYAWGLRNPWRWSFDRQTGDIWLGDVGESTREEVDRIVRGGNYGWRCFEGTQRTPARSCGSRRIRGRRSPSTTTLSGELSRAATSTVERQFRLSSVAMSSATSRPGASGTFRMARSPR